jgi:hypothetical protein
MNGPRPGLGEILDEGAELVRGVAAPFVGILALTSLPLRLGQAHFASRIVELGDEVGQYGDHLAGIALWLGLALVVSLWGRAVFVRAVSLHARTLQDPGPAAFRLSPVGFLAYVYVALLTEIAFYATCLGVVLVPVLVLLAGLAAAVSPRMERANLLDPLRLVGRNGAQGLLLAGLLLVFIAAYVLAAVNLYLIFQLGLWLAGGVPGFDATRLTGLLQPDNPRFFCVLLAGGWLLVEPYWLAALAAYTQKLESRKSGEDLRLWFARLRAAERA